jgi:hypothetical protein
MYGTRCHPDVRERRLSSPRCFGAQCQ